MFTVTSMTSISLQAYTYFHYRYNSKQLSYILSSVSILYIRPAHSISTVSHGLFEEVSLHILHLGHSGSLAFDVPKRQDADRKSYG